jgi:hypothetical protein
MFAPLNVVFVALKYCVTLGTVYDAVTADPAEVPKLIPFAFDSESVVNEYEPLAALTTGVTPPAPGSAADSDSVKPALLLAVVPDRFVRFSVGLPCE